MFDWLIEVAKKRQISIQWISDEVASYRDCQ
jgi:hypothetical protein